MIGVPVIINHQDVSKENADEIRRGVVSDVWYNPEINWFECAGVIWDETAQNLITDKGWSVSCSYDVKLADDAGGTENNIPYDIEFLDGVFTHLAIVDNPRYERANIVFNSKMVVTNATEDAQGNLHSESNGQFVSKDGVNPNYKEELKQVIEKAKNNPTEHQKLVIGTVSKDLEEKAKENGFDISGYQHDLDVSGTRHAIKEHGQPKTEEPRGQIAITDGDFEKIPEVIYGYDDVSFTGKNKIGRETITYKKSFNDGTIMYVEEIRDKRKTLTINTMYKYKNTGNPRTFVDNNNPLSNASIYIITDNQEDFNPDIKKNEVQNNKEQGMALIEELKKLITKVENDKGEDMDDKEKVKNEKVDKRDIIRQIMAIAGKHEDNEDVRTIAKLAEKLAYDKSEAGTADNKKVKNEKEDEPKDDKPADNSKVKNESEEDNKKYEDLKKDVKEDVQNKCKNSVDNAKGGYFDKMNEIYNSAIQPTEENTYISREQKLKDAETYFAK